MKKRMTRIVSLALALLMAAALCACSGTSGGRNDSGAPPPSNSQPSGAQDGQTPAPAPADRVSVMYWCPYTGNGAERVQKIIDGFNGSQDKYFVQMEYNGGYFDQLAKLQADRKSVV